MEVTPLRLAHCDNRAATVAGPDPGQWIRAALPEGRTFTTFHYIVKWDQRPYAVSETCLVTRLLDLGTAESADQVTRQDIATAFKRSTAPAELNLAKRILEPYGKKPVALLLPEHPAEPIRWNTPVWAISKAQPEPDDIRSSRVSRLADAIKKHRGSPAHVGAKGLTYSTSQVECFLSRTQDIFPGDADCLIADAQNRIRFLIEYKKHTQQGSIADHLACRYYPRQDSRKYRALQALVDDLTTNEPPTELHVLYYKIRNPYQIRLQHIAQVDDRQLTVGRDTGDVTVPNLRAPSILSTIGHHLRPAN